MAKEMIAMILAGGQGSRLYALTQKLAKPAVPFGGKYRIIDFPLSNCVNSDIDTVGILTQYQPLELNSYIESLTVRLYQIHKELLCQEALVIPKHLLVKLFSKEERRIVLGTMKKCMDDWTALIGKEYQKSTLSRYGNCYELLEIVIHEFYRKEYISFNELKGEFIDAFEMHLRIVRKLSQNTLTKYMSCFRKIMYQDELLLMWKYIKNHAVNVLI